MTLVRLAAAAALLATGMAAVAIPAQAQHDARRNDATGRTANWVAFAQGQYQRQADGSWAELDARGQVAFRFRETGRDDWSVYLAEIGSDKQLQLDLYRMMVTIAYGNGPRSDLYPITGARYPGGAAAPTPATSGLTLRRASHADGYFEQSGSDGAWTEYGANGQPTYHFREQSRSQDAVQLVDPSRNTRVEFNMPRRMIRISWGGAPFEDLYAITATQHQGGRPANLPPPAQLPPVSYPRGNDSRAPTVNYGAQDSFKIEAGPILSQQEATARCSVLAYRVGGEWTQGWERRDGVNSVCVIRFRR